LTDKINFDDNNKCHRAIMETSVIIDELMRYSSRGWISGLAFFQFYQEGGLADLLQGLHWFGHNQ